MKTAVAVAFLIAKFLFYIVMLFMAVDPANSDGTRIVAALILVGGAIVDRLQAIYEVIEASALKQ